MEARRVVMAVVLSGAIVSAAMFGGIPAWPRLTLAAAFPDEQDGMPAAPYRTPVPQWLAVGGTTAGPLSRPKGFSAPLVNPAYAGASRLPAQVTARDLPRRWDWRERGAVTPPKDQGGCGACYAFGALSNFESRVLVEGGPIYDFSENHVKECNWEAATEWTHYGGAWGSCSGGNYAMVAHLLAQTGTVLEACDPYSDQDELCRSTCPYQKTLLDWRMISGRALPDPNMLKAYIQRYGPIDCSMNAGQGDEWEAEFVRYDGTYTLFYEGPGSTNHSVLIVGWDDDRAHKGGRGAWIVKNSWGTGWGDGGFFYIAYGSARIGTLASYLHEFGDYDPTAVLLHYDEAGGWWDAWGSNGTSAWGLCRFIPERDSEATRVEFWATDSTTDVDVYLYDRFDGVQPQGLLRQVLNLSYAEMGYFSVPISPPLALARGDEVVVVIRFANATYEKPVAIDPRGEPVQQRTYVSASGAPGTWVDLGAQAVPADVGIRLRTSGGEVPTATLTRVITPGPTRTPTPTMMGTPAGTLTATATPTRTPSPTRPSGVCLIESPHPYPDFYKQGWTLINPDLGAKASRIHFARLETEPGWDYVLIMDGKGSVVQSLDGNHPSGLWSQPVSGRTLGVQLVSDSSVTAWGFCVDQIVSTEITVCLAESEHPYPNRCDDTWTLTNPDLDAAASRLHFARLETEAGYDFVILSDAAGNEVQRLDGLNAAGTWSDEVAGPVVQVRLVSDESVSMWGFCVDEVATARKEATPSPTATVTSTRTPTGTPSPTPLPWLSATVTATPSPTATRTRGSRVLLPLVLRS